MRDVASQVIYDSFYCDIKDTIENKLKLRVKNNMYTLIPDLIYVIEDGLFWTEER